MSLSSPRHCSTTLTGPLPTIFFVWHRSFIVKSGQTSGQTNKQTHGHRVQTFSPLYRRWKNGFVACKVVAILSRPRVIYYYLQGNANYKFVCSSFNKVTMISGKHNGNTRINTSVPIVLSRYHGDVIKWKHFPRYWSFVRGIHRSLVDCPHKDQWGGALMFSLNKRLSKQSRSRWFEMPLRSLWRHCNGSIFFAGSVFGCFLRRVIKSAYVGNIGWSQQKHHTVMASLLCQNDIILT